FVWDVGYAFLVTKRRIMSMLNYNLFYSCLKMAFLVYQKTKNNIPSRINAHRDIFTSDVQLKR
ncbi:hypothetical protein, partial [Providencia sp. PROV180]